MSFSHKQFLYLVSIRYGFVWIRGRLIKTLSIGSKGPEIDPSRVKSLVKTANFVGVLLLYRCFLKKTGQGTIIEVKLGYHKKS